MLPQFLIFVFFLIFISPISRVTRAPTKLRRDFLYKFSRRSWSLREERTSFPALSDFYDSYAGCQRQQSFRRPADDRSSSRRRRGRRLVSSCQNPRERLALGGRGNRAGDTIRSTTFYLPQIAVSAAKTPIAFRPATVAPCKPGHSNAPSAISSRRLVLPIARALSAARRLLSVSPSSPSTFLVRRDRFRRRSILHDQFSNV